MKISELIEKLQEVQEEFKEHGDLDVDIFPPNQDKVVPIKDVSSASDARRGVIALIEA